MAAGGALGSVARYLATLGIGAWLGGAYPWGTLAVNLLGSFAIGVVLRLVADGVWSPGGDERLFAAIGVLGGFTTFSSFSGETLGLLRSGAYPLALAYGFGSVVAGVACAAVGFAVGRHLAA